MEEFGNMEQGEKFLTTILMAILLKRAPKVSDEYITGNIGGV